MAHREGCESTAGPLRASARRLEDGGDSLDALGTGDGPRVAFAAPGGPTIAGAGAAASLAASGPDRFATIRDAAADRFDALAFDGPPVARPRLLGGFSFDDDSTWDGFPGGRFVLPRLQTVTADGERWLTVTVPDSDGATAALEEATDAALARIRPNGGLRRGRDRSANGSAAGARTDGPAHDRAGGGASDTTDGEAPGVRSTEQRPTRAVWEANVRDAVQRIETEPLRKVVLAGSLSAELAGRFDLRATLSRLGETYPDCYRFAVDPGDGAAFFGATPERLVERDGAAVRTTALAGSAGRGDTAAEDERLARGLATSEKGRREHELVVEAVQEQLAPFVRRVDVGERELRALETVQHLETPIEGTLAEPTHALDIAGALHPTPAVGGLPPAAAMRVIRETESFDRGWYAGPVGWFDAAGDGTFAVGIRSALVEGAHATLYAGNGIVGDSDPAAEWAELQLKYRPVLDHLR